jgi:hypothetical protein
MCLVSLPVTKASLYLVSEIIEPLPSPSKRKHVYVHDCIHFFVLHSDFLIFVLGMLLKMKDQRKIVAMVL